ncbi:hypothetical protein CPB84DRAFT_1828331 [Gymnopilus junonius]|uniref:Uncharacterized protein n=1 Tax=Gymnopilus junonius TaxID=109634 RepID=A0A9P5NF29_GYMJU|nr:hypothetical protein CPB84DRAFT_1828331 [Gymnopilus junonius]
MVAVSSSSVSVRLPTLCASFLISTLTIEVWGMVPGGLLSVPASGAAKNADVNVGVSSQPDVSLTVRGGVVEISFTECDYVLKIVLLELYKRP